LIGWGEGVFRPTSSVTEEGKGGKNRGLVKTGRKKRKGEKKKEFSVHYSGSRKRGKGEKRGGGKKSLHFRTI